MKRKTQDARRGIDRIVDILLKNRGITTAKDKELFFNPPNPNGFKARELGISESQLKKAVSRIKRAIKDKEKIIVYGDYDVDGICATAILWETLYALGANTLPYIPHRVVEGYGLNEESIKKLKIEDPELSLIITVDHGIVAHQKVDFAKSIGVDVIVTDHHEPGGTMPDAYAVIHTKEISGSAVAWFLAREISISELAADAVTQTDDHLGLAALGTIADVLPLLGYNRAIAVHGLKELRASTRLGIKTLCEEAGVNQKEIETFHIGFILGPRLNAAGRVEHALASLRLLCTKDENRARILALELGKTNRLRQEKTDVALKHIEETYSVSWKNGGLPRIIFVHHESFEEGIIGVVAGRLVEKYYRPAIVMSMGAELSKASARSVLGVNIVELIKTAGGDMFTACGGHQMAAGFSLATENIKILHKKLLLEAEKIDGESFLRRSRVDAEVDFSDICEDLYTELGKFSPYGYGNPEPTFMTRGVFVKDARLVGKDNTHIKLSLHQKDNGPDLAFGAIGFRMAEVYSKIASSMPVDVIYSLTLDSWNGNHRLELKLKDIKPAG